VPGPRFNWDRAFWERRIVEEICKRGSKEDGKLNVHEPFIRLAIVRNVMEGQRGRTFLPKASSLPDLDVGGRVVQGRLKWQDLSGGFSAARSRLTESQKKSPTGGETLRE